MNEVKKARIVYIKEHFLLLCKKDLVKALILDRLVFYYQQYTEAYDLLEEETKEGVAHKLDSSSRGWVKKSAAFLADSLLVGESDRTIQRKLDELFNLGYIKRKRNAGEAYWYQPNMLQITQNLEMLGYDLEGNPVKGGTDDQRKPTEEQQKEHEHDQRTEFSEIPSVPTKGDEGGYKNLKESQNWAAKFPCLDHAPPDVREISKLISETTGFEPNRTGKDTNWISSVSALWAAAGGNKTVLLDAIEEGNSKRLDPKNPLTFGGPRSYVKYAQDIVARNKLRKSGHSPARIKVGQTNEPNGSKLPKREKIKFGMQSMAS